MSEESRLGREQIETAYALKQIITGRRARSSSTWRTASARSTPPTDKIMPRRQRLRGRDRAREGAAADLRRACAGRPRRARHRAAWSSATTTSASNGPRRAPRSTRPRPPSCGASSSCTRAGTARGGSRSRSTPRARPRRRRAGPGAPGRGRPSTIGAILTRPLYAARSCGTAVTKRDAWGRRQSQRRAPADWIRCAVPALAIVPEPLWQAVAARRAATRAAYVRTTTGGSTAGPRAASRAAIS